MDKGQLICVTRGRHKNCTGAIEGIDNELAGFYWVWLDQFKSTWRRGVRKLVPTEPIRVMLAEGQLAIKR